MIQNDTELIQRTLAGDENAFGSLVKKYQKAVHALAWRKIGDFHVAQEITQDAFLKAYQKLSTLKNHNAFSGWVYVNVTADLPFPITEFKAIAFVGLTVYVGTDSGVAYSSDGVNWHATTDAEGETLIMKRFAVEGTTVYGTTGQYVYQLKENASTWKQVTPEIPDSVLSFAVDGNVLYVGTSSSGVIRFALEE